MSRFTLEKILWDITVNPSIASNSSLIDNYRLAPDERALIDDMDVRAIADRDVSQMLTWMAWVATRGFVEAPEYMRRMNTPA